ncbi:MAG: amino acid permease [Candidatus Marinimicrobia bacterium]|nr:amino acid permease [Candidatus Neomarinimicrobiota bacterium]|tara:strand:- start:484 stop:1848 length:1365 start_codon:yes stop_codon:yes gene_type:complete
MKAKNQSPKLEPKLELFDSSMMVIGIVIGSGIFMTTGLMAESIPSISLILITWIFGGLQMLAGALTYAELGAAMPKAGGQYVYLREAYGPLPAFLFGWVAFIAYLTGTNAAIAVAVSEHLGTFYPTISTHNTLLSIPGFSISGGQIFALFLIVLLTIINYVGVVFGKWIQNIFTILKIGSILIFSIAGLMVSTTHQLDFSLNPTNLSIGSIFTGMGIALVAVNWTVGGWEYITFAASEIKNPQKNLPRALIIGTIIILVLYFLINISYLKVLPMDSLSGEIKVGEATAKAVYGSKAAGAFAIVMIISMFGSLNGNILVGPRISYAMAKDKLFFPKAAKVHPKFYTPGNAILIQGFWAAVLTLSGTFEELITLVVFVQICMWIAASSTVFVLRKKLPHLERPYKVWGYPYIPGFFIFFSVAIMINTFFSAPIQSLIGLLLTLLGIPVYYYLIKKI